LLDPLEDDRPAAAGDAGTVLVLPHAPAARAFVLVRPLADLYMYLGLLKVRFAHKSTGQPFQSNAFGPNVAYSH